MRSVEASGQVLLALAGAAVVLMAARTYGLGVGPDSLVYLDGARSLAAGQGYRELLPEGGSIPLTHFPPVLSLVLAVGARAGFDPVNAALGLNAFCFAASVLLACRIAHDASGASPWAGLLGGVALIAGVEVASRHAYVASEPLFLFLFLAFLWLLADALARGSGSAGLLPAAAVAGLSATTRYVGISLLIAGGIAILVASASRPRARRFAKLLSFGVIASVPLGLFVLRNQLLSGAPTDALIYIRRISRGDLLTSLRTASCWLLPEAFPVVLRAAVLVLLLLVVVHALVGKDERGVDLGMSRRRTFGIVVGVFACSYVIVLAAARLLADGSIPFDGRLLLPLQVSLTLLAVAETMRITSDAGRGVATAARLAVAAVLCVGLARTARYAYMTGTTGLAYSGRQWQESRVLAALRALPRNVTVYSNLPNVVMHLDGRRCARTPFAFDEKRLLENPQLESDLSAWRTDFGRRVSALVFWRRSEAAARPSEGELLGGMQVRTLVADEDGAVYASRTLPELAR